MPKIMIVYHSRTGNTRKMADLIAEGARSREGTEVELVEAAKVNMDNVVSADGLAIGSPDYYSYMCGQLKIFFDEAYFAAAKLKGKPYVAFVSHGGGGSALDSIDRLASSIGLKRVAPGVKCQGAPRNESAEECRKLGRALADAVKT